MESEKQSTNEAPDPATVEQLIVHGAAQFEAAGLWFGHGSDNAYDEAAELVFFGAGFAHEQAIQAYRHEVTAEQRQAVLALFDRRIRERIPAAYLTHRMWFAGYEFYVDERVLVPRSPIAELVEARFAPWVVAEGVQRLLDIGTGSGCIAIAAALELPHAIVDAADVSEAALAVAQTNIERHRLAERVHARLSDVYDGLGDTRYDLIVANPPYVGDEEMRSLPEEYRHEPVLGLHSGADGLQVVRRILRDAQSHLTPQGVLIVEVGNSEDALQAAYPRVPFTWLEFERGGGGVFVLTAQQVAEHASDLSAVAP